MTFINSCQTLFINFMILVWQISQINQQKKILAKSKDIVGKKVKGIQESEKD